MYNRQWISLYHLKRRTLSYDTICFCTLIFNVCVFLSPGSVAMCFLEIPLQTEFPVFWEFLGIPRYSQKFPIIQITLANRIPSFLGIPRNSQKFSTMQINSDLKSLELLGISGKGRLQFCEDLEFLWIPMNSQLYKLPII